MSWPHTHTHTHTHTHKWEPNDSTAAGNPVHPIICIKWAVEQGCWRSGSGSHVAASLSQSFKDPVYQAQRRHLALTSFYSSFLIGLTLIWNVLGPECGFGDTAVAGAQSALPWNCSESKGAGKGYGTYLFLEGVASTRKPSVVPSWDFPPISVIAL